MTVKVKALQRFPVKGLNGTSVERLELYKGRRIAGDRAFALAHGSAPWDSSSPQWLPPKYFHTLRRDPKLAQLTASYEPASGLLTLQRLGHQVAQGNITTPLGRAMIGQFFAGFLGPEGHGIPKLVEADPDHALTDVPTPWISLLNLASVEDLQRVARQPLDPRRFRANILVEGAAAWSELAWVGQEIKLGSARLRVMEPIERCAATNVNPDSAEVDLNLPLLLRCGYGHCNMGVYCEVVEGGEVAVGSSLEVPEPVAEA